MDLDPPICELPFIVQRTVMDFSPRLPWMTNIEIVLRHISTRYCPQCGEYMDYSCKRRPVRHIHFGRAKYRLDVYRYEARDVSLFMNLFNKPHITAITRAAYRIRKIRDFKTDMRLIFRVRGNRVFFNLSRILQARSFHPTEMMNIKDFNIFQNPEFYTPEEFAMYIHPGMTMHDGNMNRSFHLRAARIQRVDTDNHYRHIFKTICQLMRWSDHYMVIYIDLMITHPLLLSMLIHLYPQQTMDTLCESKKTPDDFLLDLIKNDVRLLQHIRDRKMTDLFSRHSSWFTTLYETNDLAREYFSFIDPVQDTIDVRENIFHSDF